MADSLTGQVVDRLTAEIRDGDVTAGQRLPTEVELMRRFSVSRTVIREAVARLRAAGLVESQQGRGTFVLTRPSQLRFEFGDQAVRSVPEIIALVEFRIGIEGEAAALAARRRDDHDLARIRTAGERSHSESSATHSIKADFDFHHTIARASGNHYYPELLSALGPLMILTPKGRRTAGHTADSVHAEHLAVLTAITDRDPQAAAAAMRLHLINSAERVRREQ